MKKIIAALMIAGMAVLSTGCYGSFAVTKKIYKWNGKVAKEPVPTIVMWAFLIIPVYGVSGLLDFFILNTLEFWTGSNPLAKGDSEATTYLAKTDKGDLLLTQKRDVILIAKKEKPEEVIMTLHYDQTQGAWFAKGSNDQMIKVAEFDAENPQKVTLFNAAGKGTTVQIKS